MATAMIRMITIAAQTPMIIPVCGDLVRGFDWLSCSPLVFMEISGDE